MKASDKPEITKKWASELPNDVDAKDLEKALANAEKALSAADKKKGDAGAITECLSALEALRTAASKTVKKCDKKKHKEVISVLEKFDDLIDDETERLKELKEDAAKQEGDEEEDDEDDKGVFKEEYVARMIKKLRSGSQLNFGFGLNKQAPADSCIVLCNKRQPERLFKMLKQRGEFSNRLITYGTAMGDGKVMEFQLAENAKEPSQILKLAKVFLKNNKELKFKKIRVVSGGQNFEDDMEDAGQGGDLGAELARLETLVAAWQQTLQHVGGQIEKLRQSLNGQKDEALQTVSDGLGNVMSQFPDLDLSKLVAAAKANDRAAYDQTLSQTAKEVHEVHELLTKGPLLSTIDENPFVDTKVHEAVNSTLQRITTELGLSA